MTCFLTRAGFRKRGVSRALARAAVGFARERGARAIEGYPMITKNVILEELHLGTETFRERRLHRGQPSHAATCGDADRLLTPGEGAGLPPTRDGACG